MKYKHKKLWWIAKPSEDKNTTYYVEWHYWVIFKELIENSNDRELQSEKDWIDEMYNDMYTKEDEDLFRLTIENNMPKITEEELQNCCDLWIELTIEKVENLLKEKWLYKKIIKD